MGEFRSGGRGRSGGGFGRPRRDFGERSNGRSSGGYGERSGGRGGFGGRDGGRSDRRPLEMHDVTCSKCGKQCQVPFKPTGSKPVFCSDCFRKNEGSGGNFGSRNGPQSEASSEQMNQINAKLDRIIKVLQDLEMDDSEDGGKDSEESLETERN